MSRIPVLLFFALIVTISPPARGTVHEGFASLNVGEGWDFSEAALSPVEGLPNRFTDLVYFEDPGYWPEYPRGLGTLDRPLCGIAHARWSYDQLLLAPLSTEANYTPSSPAISGGVYVLITCERHYVKFRVVHLGPQVTIEYAYQDNGSRVLDSQIPVEKQTWGKIKAQFER